MVKCALVIINVPLCLHAQIINTAGNLAVKLKNQSLIHGSANRATLVIILFT